MKKYKLLKDMPLCEAGSLCVIRKRDGASNYVGESVFEAGGNGFEEVMLPGELQAIRENGKFDEWFEEIEESKVWEPDAGESYWYIDEDAGAFSDINLLKANPCDDRLTKRLEIGNCFKTKEDAEKAIGKLKALRRLRKAGLKFSSYCWDDHDVLEISAKLPWIGQICPEYDQISDDLHRVFGKED